MVNAVTKWVAKRRNNTIFAIHWVEMHPVTPQIKVSEICYPETNSKATAAMAIILNPMVVLVCLDLRKTFLINGEFAYGFGVYIYFSFTFLPSEIQANLFDMTYRHDRAKSFLRQRLGCRIWIFFCIPTIRFQK